MRLPKIFRKLSWIGKQESIISIDLLIYFNDCSKHYGHQEIDSIWESNFEWLRKCKLFHTLVVALMIYKNRTEKNKFHQTSRDISIRRLDSTLKTKKYPLVVTLGYFFSQNIFFELYDDRCFKKIQIRTFWTFSILNFI